MTTLFFVLMLILIALGAGFLLHVLFSLFTEIFNFILDSPGILGFIFIIVATGLLFLFYGHITLGGVSVFNLLTKGRL